MKKNNKKYKYCSAQRLTSYHDNISTGERYPIHRGRGNQSYIMITHADCNYTQQLVGIILPSAEKHS